MCSTSCPLTENPAVYIWYKNRKFLYQDWSPWYQQLVSSEEAVTYSCAIKGYEDLRAPQVSVDSVTSTCFSVTYAKGRMCSYKTTSEEEPCSITYPREVHVQRSPAAKGHVTLTCNTSCPLTPFIWYKSGHVVEEPKFVVPNTSAETFSCGVKGREDLRSAEVCVKDENCLIVNYVSRRICALRGSSVNISSEYSSPNYQPKSKLWYKIKRSGQEEVKETIKNVTRMKYHDNFRNHHILRINKLTKNDSAEYTFRHHSDDQGLRPGVSLVVTGLRVKFTPSAVVTEGQRLTLSCSTSCPLTDNTNYIWYLNSRPLTPTEKQNKHLVLDPVSRQHAGNYSCAVKTPHHISSNEKTLTVQSKMGKWTPAAAAAVAVVCAALLVIIPLAAFWWIRRKRTSSQPPRTETSDNLEQLNLGSLHHDISAQPTEDDLNYSRVHFPQNHTDALYSTVQKHEEQEDVPYAVVNFRPNMTIDELTDSEEQAVDL
ncbi:uncharacterized protein LOC114564700 [Perca flavescens]|nr:uncharacterized protein LOC114564700 [Perca flavescens]